MSDTFDLLAGLGSFALAPVSCVQLVPLYGRSRSPLGAALFCGVDSAADGDEGPRWRRQAAREEHARRFAGVTRCPVSGARSHGLW